MTRRSPSSVVRTAIAQLADAQDPMRRRMLRPWRDHVRQLANADDSTFYRLALGMPPGMIPCDAGPWQGPTTAAWCSRVSAGAAARR